MNTTTYLWTLWNDAMNNVRMMLDKSLMNTTMHLQTLWNNDDMNDA